MARPVNPECQYTIKPHKLGNLVYASTQPPHISPETGKKVYKYIHWGRIVDNKFLPGHKFFMASPEERSKLIFPQGMDLSEINGISGIRKPGHQASPPAEENRFYGDIWLLEQIARKVGLYDDLMVVFNENEEIVKDILTLAMFPYLTGYSYNRVTNWQRIERTPSSHPLNSTYITRLTQSITEADRMAFMRLRGRRLKKQSLCAVDSTSRCAYGDSLADVRYGKNKEGLPLPSTTEVVVYTVSEHMPVYYRTFPGNFPDARSLDVILLDLAHASFRNIILVTDRGYDSLQNLEKYILKKQPMIMCVKVGQSLVLEKIKQFGSFFHVPEGMAIDTKTMLYYKQYDVDYTVVGANFTRHKGKKLKLNIYLDSVRRSLALREMDAEIAGQEAVLAGLLGEQAVMDDDRTVKRKYRFFDVVCDADSRVIQSYALNAAKVDKARVLAGFFANITQGIDADAMEAYHLYKLRDEQEKYFEQMKGQLGADRQNNWSEAGAAGRRFILFVSMIMSSYVRYVWRSTDLHDKFSSSLEILDEMRPIRCVQHSGHDEYITPFVGKQKLICEAFGFEIPKGCDGKYTSRKVVPKKRGRPKKAEVEVSL